MSCELMGGIFVEKLALTTYPERVHLSNQASLHALLLHALEILPLFSALTNGILALYAWPRRHIPAVIWFFWMMVGMSGWSIFYALNTATTDLQLKNRFFIGAHCFFCITLYATLPMTLIVMGNAERFSRFKLAIFAICATCLNFHGVDK